MMNVEFVIKDQKVFLKVINYVELYLEEARIEIEYESFAQGEKILKHAKNIVKRFPNCGLKEQYYKEIIHLKELLIAIKEVKNEIV